MTPSLVEIFCEVLERFQEHFSPLLNGFQRTAFQERCEIYSLKLREAGSPLDSCVRFSDATNVYNCEARGVLQRATYNGHKRRNCLKFQVITAPDGTVLHLFGPVEGRRHDMTLYRQSNIESALSSSVLYNNNQYYAYSDSAYVLRPFLQVGFKGPHLTDSQKTFNMTMSKLRVSMEWAFKDVKKYFTRVDATQKMNIPRSPVALWYVCSVILWNLKNSLYGSQTSRFFQIDPIPLQEYVQTLH